MSGEFSVKDKCKSCQSLFQNFRWVLERIVILANICCPQDEENNLINYLESINWDTYGEQFSQVIVAVKLIPVNFPVKNLLSRNIYTCVRCLI